MAVKVDPVIGVSGFIHAGNRVDVLVTIVPDKNASSNPVTKIVLENILVLAAGPDVEKKGKEPTNVNVITLEVAPEEAEKLALAATEGKLQLALRNFNDTDDVRTKGTTVPILLASYNAGKREKRDSCESKGGQKSSPEAKTGPGKCSFDYDRTKPPQPEMKAAKPMYTVELIQGNKISAVKFEREDGSR